MEETFEGQDKRQYFRVSPALGNPVNVRFNWQDTMINSQHVRDISLGGVAFAFPLDIVQPSLGTTISEIDLEIPYQGGVPVQGVVCRYDTLPDHSTSVCAIQFTRIPTGAERKLFQYINQRQRELRWFTKES